MKITVPQQRKLIRMILLNESRLSSILNQIDGHLQRFTGDCLSASVNCFLLIDILQMFFFIRIYFMIIFLIIV